jgi:nucleoside triphosphatase
MLNTKQYPEPIAGLFIQNKQDKLLLVKSYKWGDRWCVPGGHIELGEAIKATVKREAMEEVGLIVDFIKIFAVFDAINPMNFHEKRHFIFIECLCKSESDIVAIDNKEIQSAVWFDLKEVNKLNIEPYTKKALEKLQNKSGCIIT